MLVTNRLRYRLLEGLYRNNNIPTGYGLALCTAATAPTEDTNTLGQLDQIATGNGYSDGGASVSRNSTDFDVATEDDSKQWALVQLKDFTFTASGGSIPASGDRARYAVLTDNNVTVANREVFAAWDLGAEDFVHIAVVSCPRLHH